MKGGLLSESGVSEPGYVSRYPAPKSPAARAARSLKELSPGTGG
jgi:hypothetical protein